MMVTTYCFITHCHTHCTNVVDVQILCGFHKRNFANDIFKSICERKQIKTEEDLKQNALSADDSFKCVKSRQLECGQMPNVMVALPNTGGALCSTPQSLADAHYWSAMQ